MDRGDIYLIARSEDVEDEGSGPVPVLVISPIRFNRVTRLPIVLPITNPETATRTAGFAVSLEGAGVATRGVVRCDQPRTLDFTIGEPQRVEKLPLAYVDEVMAKLAAIISI